MEDKVKKKLEAMLLDENYILKRKSYDNHISDLFDQNEKKEIEKGKKILDIVEAWIEDGKNGVTARQGIQKALKKLKKVI